MSDIAKAANESLNKRKQRQERLILISVLMLGVLSIAVGIRGEETWAHFGDAFAVELGIAFVIGSLLAGTIERYTRHRAEAEHNRMRVEIEEDVFRHLFGFGLHKSIVDELTETVFASKLRRDFLSLRYEFDGCEDQQFVHVRLTVSYHIVSTSRSIEKVQVKHYFENMLRCGDDHDCFTSVLVEGGRQTYRANREQLIQHTKKAGIRRLLDGPTVDVVQERPVRVQYSCEFIRRKTDSEVWITTVPATALRLTVAVLDPNLDNLAFAPDASHREEPELLTKLPDCGGRVYEWRLSSGVLPYQGIVLYWCPSNAIAPVDSSDADGGSFVYRKVAAGPSAPARSGNAPR